MGEHVPSLDFIWSICYRMATWESLDEKLVTKCSNNASRHVFALSNLTWVITQGLEFDTSLGRESQRYCYMHNCSQKAFMIRYSGSVTVCSWPAITMHFLAFSQMASLRYRLTPDRHTEHWNSVVSTMVGSTLKPHLLVKFACLLGSDWISFSPHRLLAAYWHEVSLYTETLLKQWKLPVTVLKTDKRRSDPRGICLQVLQSSLTSYTLLILS